MAKTRPSVQKRIKEAKAQERRQIKAARKAAREAARAAAGPTPEGVDPDLIGITAGPPALKWYEQEEEAERKRLKAEGIADAM
jgi:phage/plasmid-associated DNA primase